MPFLIVRSGPRAGERIELVDELVVGRENADLTVSDEEVSRRHLAVRPHEDGVELEDLGSTNGTFVDGARLSAVVVVSSTARVILGETELEIEVEEPEPEFDPGVTRLRERPPERDATIVAPVPAAPAPDATIAGAPVPPAPPRPPVAPAEPPRAAPAPAPVAAAPAPAAPAPAAPTPAAPTPATAGAAGARPFGSFTPAAPARRRGGAATRQWGAAGIVFLVIIATAIALIVYFAAR
jgi:predicted component of type VI protein secretion system